MKTLLFIRHAKSDKTQDIQDIDRPLNARGRRDAPEMGRRLAKLGILPELILVSPSQRTRETIDMLLQSANWQIIESRIETWIYEAGVAEYMNRIEILDNNMSTVCFVGHNPTITQIVSYLTGNHSIEMPTSGISVISFNVDCWNKTSTGKGNLLHFDYPKNL